MSCISFPPLRSSHAGDCAVIGPLISSLALQDLPLEWSFGQSVLQISFVKQEKHDAKLQNLNLKYLVFLVVYCEFCAHNITEF